MKRFVFFIVTPLIRGFLHILCRIDAQELRKLPGQGPYIIVMNHVNFLEVPILYTILSGRRPYSLVKEETWKNPFLRLLAWIWDAVPVKRGTADFAAFRAAEKILSSGGILIIAPEGTRSRDGVLRRGHPGAAFLALRHRVPVYPVAHSGGELFSEHIRKLRRTSFRLRVGLPFFVSAEKSGHLRQEVTDEIMGQLAVLLPEKQRGVYAVQALRKPAHLKPVPSPGGEDG